ncbi:unnamed protein product [Medioppia subpectinata]|uniref:Ionotropic glutamate receptor L-glutamate and glycine-binding domain-containing protein n=1 Tax=Medioppia subpectinata TaxID=1979941 RepID=A0A7R9Q1A9_9ACAR|nr:unnamed protein product [Medioppia subpectinata]CAG2109029.1 unnamed protein product [Medioppia subpectinata]
MKQLSVATNENAPYMSGVKRYISDKTQAIDGIDGQLLRTLSQCFNFTYRLVDCNRQWGNRLPNNTWDGL